MRALRTFKDGTEITRKNGEEWLITLKETEAHIPDVYEEVSNNNPKAVCTLLLVHYCFTTVALIFIKTTFLLRLSVL